MCRRLSERERDGTGSLVKESVARRDVSNEEKEQNNAVWTSE